MQRHMIVPKHTKIRPVLFFACLALAAGWGMDLPAGKKDDTHFSSLGARVIAALVAEQIPEPGVPLKNALKPGPPEPLIDPEKIVMLDCFYNNEWKMDAAGQLVRYHYVWSDTANSGFSMLGSIITGTGASIDTLCQAPTPASLQRASVYIIVDPDTPQETPSPNYVDQHAITAITAWVRAGGVLVLMGNDKGNAEFEHFNRLAGEFGITFNEDSRNRVLGRDFRTGTFDKFPDHPLFAGVKRIFIKELSTLQVRQPATVLLADGGDNIIAFARVGKGAVFAVGDPWFYNEYMDERKLPAGYDNQRAAKNLFRWLLEPSGG